MNGGGEKQSPTIVEESQWNVGATIIGRWFFNCRPLHTLDSVCDDRVNPRYAARYAAQLTTAIALLVSDSTSRCDGNTGWNTVTSLGWPA